MAIETVYKVGNLEFDNWQDAEIFDGYSTFFQGGQLKQLYLGYKSKIDYKIYLNPKFDYQQME